MYSLRTELFCLNIAFYQVATTQLINNQFLNVSRKCIVFKLKSEAFLLTTCRENSFRIDCTLILNLRNFTLTLEFTLNSKPESRDFVNKQAAQ